MRLAAPYRETQYRLVTMYLLVGALTVDPTTGDAIYPSPATSRRIRQYTKQLSLWQILAKALVTYGQSPLAPQDVERLEIIISTRSPIAPRVAAQVTDEREDSLDAEPLGRDIVLADDDPELVRRLAELFNDVPVKPLPGMVESEISDRARRASNGVTLVELLHFLMVTCHRRPYQAAKWQRMKAAAQEFNRQITADIGL